MSTRATVAAAIASLGVLGAGWNAATAYGHAIPAQPTTTTSPTSSTTTAPTTMAPASAPAAPTASALADGTWTGKAVTHRFGSVTVTITVQGGRIAAVSERVIDDGQRKSQSINARAVPTLRSEVVAASSAEVGSVSGATYTSRAYLTSLQSALDQAAS